MRYTRNVTPLLVCSLSQPLAFALLPVPMLHARPSSEPQLFARFYKPLGQLIPLHEDDALRVRKYMARNNTKALTSDGQVAFMLHGNQLMECDPEVCGQPPEQLFVSFYPQHWIGDNAAVQSSPAEPVDVTDAVLGMPATVIAALRDGTASADALVDPEARGHLGPYTVTCEAALRSFLGVSNLSELTQEIVDKKQAGAAGRAAVHAAPDLEGGSVWTLAVGTERAYSTCHVKNV